MRATSRRVATTQYLLPASPHGLSVADQLHDAQAVSLPHHFERPRPNMMSTPSPAPSDAFRRFTLPQLLFIILVAFSHVYYSYRWILRYNSDSTSPTYSSTPPAFELLKYPVLLALVYFIIVALALKRHDHGQVPAISWVFAAQCGVFLAYISLRAVLQQLTTQASGATFAVEAKGIFVIPVAIVCPFVWAHLSHWQTKRILLLAKSLFYFQLVFTSVEISSFVFLHRLPALAYYGGLSRFGGSWDDPNAFSIYVSMCIIGIFALYSVSTRKRFLLIALLICTGLMVLTYSFSGWLSCICGLLAYSWTTRRATSRAIGLLSLAPPVILALSLSLSSLQRISFISFVLTAKQQSASLHLAALDNFIFNTLTSGDLSSFLFGADSIHFEETAYASFLQNYGFFSSAWALLLLGTTVTRCLRRALSKDRRVTEGVRVYYRFVTACLITFLVGNLFIPYFTVFPVNLYFWILVASVWITPVRGTTRFESEYTLLSGTTSATTS